MKWTAFVHGSRENNCQRADCMGLTGEAASLFKHALTELEVDLDVHADGTYEILEIREGKKRFLAEVTA